MLQPFAAVETPGKNDPTNSPVRKHSDPDTHRPEAQDTDQKNTEAEPARPHVQQEVIMENFTSPAARRPYPGTNAIVHTTGFTMVIHVIMWMHISALVLSIPPRIVTGLTKIYTIRQLTIIIASAMTQSFFM